MKVPTILLPAVLLSLYLASVVAGADAISSEELRILRAEIAELKAELAALRLRATDEPKKQQADVPKQLPTPTSKSLPVEYLEIAPNPERSYSRYYRASSRRDTPHGPDYGYGNLMIGIGGYGFGVVPRHSPLPRFRRPFAPVRPLLSGD